MRPSKLAKLPAEESSLLLAWVERLKASLRARVEHPFHIVKNLFKHRKARYRGLAKNTVQMYTLFALANLVIGKARLLAGGPQGVRAS